MKDRISALMDGELDDRSATLAIDASNDWHVAYVDGNAEALRYMKIIGGESPSAPEIVDDGLSLDGAPFEDGLHLVGDDANITVAPGGDVRISYQDATAGKLRFAVGAPGAAYTAGDCGRPMGAARARLRHPRHLRDRTAAARTGAWRAQGGPGGAVQRGGAGRHGQRLLDDSL